MSIERELKQKNEDIDKIAKSLNPLPKDRVRKIAQGLKNGISQNDLAPDDIEPVKRNKTIVELDLDY